VGLHAVGEGPQAAAVDAEIGLRSFPAGKATVRLYDLEAKKRIAEAAFEKEHALRLPAGAQDLFAVVGP
jgi:hypothetical protein